MTWTLSQSGTTSALTIGTETTLATDTNNGTFVLEVDTSNMALGDLLEIRVYTITLSGGSLIQEDKGTFQHIQINNHKRSPWIASDQSIKCTLKQIAGTGRTFAWKMLRDASAGGGGATAAAVATAVWQDLLVSSDFTTSASVGALLAKLTNLQYTVPAIGRGTVGASASATSIPTSAFAPSPDTGIANQFQGRVVLFDATTATVALRGQVSVISASTAAPLPTLTVSTLTTAPASGDTFSVI